MADLIIRSRNLVVSMGGASSVKSESRPSNFALLMFFGAEAKVTSCVKSVNTIVNESVEILVSTDYIPLSTNLSIGNSIQIHGPPMVDNRTYLHSFTVFTVNSKMSYQNKKNTYKLNNRKCG